MLPSRLYSECNEHPPHSCFIGGGTRSPSVKAWMTEEEEHCSGRGEATRPFTGGNINCLASCFQSTLLDSNHFSYFKDINLLNTKQCFNYICLVICKYGNNFLFYLMRFLLRNCCLFRYSFQYLIAHHWTSSSH